MKTLKKTLCLVLAMVMVFGLCTISASAKLDSYSDKDSIKYEEAVDVLSGIGILQGSSGAFRPQATITRAEAAKIIAYMVIGDSKQADALKASSDPFTDVSADYWAAGYIAYCNSVGIIKGMGDGSYHPLDNVTGLQFATMLLRALGYGKNGEFEGSDWSINASKWALSLKLFDGNLAGASATEEATREECALYAFNTITGPKKVTYSELLGGYTTTTTNIGNAANANMEETFAKDFKLDKKGADEDDFGRPTGHYWYIDSGKREAITATYGADKNLKETYTAKVNGGDIYSLIDGAGKMEAANLEVYRNGEDQLEAVVPEVDEEEDTPAKALIKTFKKADDTQIEGTGAGVETYVYSWYEDETVGDKTVSELHIKICIVDTYLAQVTEIIDATAKEDRKVEVNDLYSETEEDPLDDVDLTYATDDFDEDDYVLITVAKDKIQSMVKAEPIKDEVTRVTKTGSKISIVVNGTTYTAAKNAINPGKGQSAADFDRSLVDGEDHVIFVDNHGYVIGANDVKTESNYVFVSHFGDKTDVSGDFDGKGIAAKVYYADGTSAVVAVKSIDGTTIDDKTEASDLSTGIYKLTMDGSKAKLVGDSVEATGAPKKSRPSTVAANESAATVNSKTVFFYVNGAENLPAVADGEWEDITVTAYIGIGTIPANKDGEDATNVMAIVDDEDIVAVLVDDKAEGESDDTVYMYTGDYVADRTGWTVHYKTYVDGKEADLDVKYSDKDDKDAGTKDVFAPVAGKFVTVKGKTPKTVGDGAKEYSKSKYYDDIDALSADTLTTSEISVTDGVDAAFAQGKDLKIVNITDKGKDLTTLKKLVAAVDEQDEPAYTTIKIAVQVKDGEVVTLYITELVETPEPEEVVDAPVVDGDDGDSGVGGGGT